MEFNKERFLNLETKYEISRIVNKLCWEWSGDKEIPFIDIVDLSKEFNKFEVKPTKFQPTPFDVINNFFNDEFFLVKDSLSTIEKINLKLIIEKHDFDYRTEEFAEFIR